MDIHIPNAHATIPRRITKSGNSRIITIPKEYAHLEAIVVLLEPQHH